VRITGGQSRARGAEELRDKRLKRRDCFSFHSFRFFLLSPESKLWETRASARRGSREGTKPCRNSLERSSMKDATKIGRKAVVSVASSSSASDRKAITLVVLLYTLKCSPPPRLPAPARNGLLDSKQRERRSTPPSTHPRRPPQSRDKCRLRGWRRLRQQE
jgi:hypothetical protein